jgi:hypothetical protein
MDFFAIFLLALLVVSVATMVFYTIWAMINGDSTAT